MEQEQLINQLDNQLAGTRTRAEDLLAELSDEQLIWKPSRDGWSVAECFEHLRRVDLGYVRSVSRALKSSEPSTSSRPHRPTLMGRMMLWGSGPTPVVRIPAPRIARPEHVPLTDGRTTVQAFLQAQTQVADLIEQAREYDLSTVKVTSPLSRWVLFNLGDALAIVVAHEQRHLNQAIRVTEAKAFPAP